MNRKMMLLFAAGGAAILFAADQPKKEPNEFEKLKAKVTLLEGRIDQLEARVQSLSRSGRVSFTEPGLPIDRESSIPPNIGEFEVNGLKVYKVPLARRPN